MDLEGEGSAESARPDARQLVFELDYMPHELCAHESRFPFRQL
jgi:hypothetical protein